MGPEESWRIERRVITYEEAVAQPTESHEYQLRGVQVDELYGIGIKVKDEEPRSIDQLLDTTYDAIIDTAAAGLDWQRLRTHIGPEQWPYVGECQVDPAGDTEAELTVALTPEWTPE